MFTILLRRTVSKSFAKAEESALRLRMIFQRTFYTSNVSSSRIGQKRHAEVWNLTQGLKLSKDPDDLGKVIEIDLDSLQKEDVNNVTKRKKDLKKKEANAANFDEKVNDNLDEKSDQVKKKFEDLRKKNTGSFSSLMTNLKSKSGREKTKQIALEGKRLIHDAIQAGHKPLKVYFSRPSDLEKLNLPEGIEIYRIPYKKLQFWSDVVTSQGVIGIFKMPDLSVLNKKNKSSIPLTVICDNIREPSNLGSILRVVASVGCQKLILTKGCVDIWEPKVLRSAAGAHFHLPVLRNITWTEVEEEIEEDYKVVLASCSPEAYEKENENNSESLTGKQTSVFTTSDGISRCLPLKCYSFVDYTKHKIAVVIGGETFGLCKEAIQFAIKRKGLRVFIPMSNQVESLNSAVALGILSYMVRHQIESSANSFHVEQKNNTM